MNKLKGIVLFVLMAASLSSCIIAEPGYGHRGGHRGGYGHHGGHYRR